MSIAVSTATAAKEGQSILELWLEGTPNSNDHKVKRERRDLLSNEPLDIFSSGLFNCDSTKDKAIQPQPLKSVCIKITLYT